MPCVCPKCEKKYPCSSSLLRQGKTDKFSVIFFGRMWGYSVVADLLRANRNQLEITKRSDGD